MSAIIDFSSNQGEALVRGFMKGLAAPAVLFATHAVPVLSEVAPVAAPARRGGDAGALASDWARIGAGLTLAVQHHHGQAQATNPAKPRA